MEQKFTGLCGAPSGFVDDGAQSLEAHIVLSGQIGSFADKTRYVVVLRKTPCTSLKIREAHRSILMCKRRLQMSSHQISIKSGH